MIVATPVSANEKPTPEQQASVPAQTTFDVVSVKPSDPKNLNMTMRPGADSFTITGASLKILIRYAYDLNDFQVEGASEWMNSARFDVIAKMDAPSAKTSSTSAEEDAAEEKLMERRLQSLLADRFQLRVHKHTKEMPAYALVVAKGGSKLQPSTNNTGFTSRKGLLMCKGTSMDSLASMLSNMENRIILDQTKLTGNYAFTLQWAPDDATNPNADLPGLVTAIQEQLGLKLVPTKSPVEMLIIDQAERPSAN
jgi:uncharacterized protein (TIGR03435 family)